MLINGEAILLGNVQLLICVCVCVCVCLCFRQVYYWVFVLEVGSFLFGVEFGQKFSKKFFVIVSLNVTVLSNSYILAYFHASYSSLLLQLHINLYFNINISKFVECGQLEFSIHTTDKVVRMYTKHELDVLNVCVENV